MYDVVPYDPPDWALAAGFSSPPSRKVLLAQTPTPLHRWTPPGPELYNLNLFIKRDDLTGCDSSGNKVRKLEFLMAECKMSEVSADPTAATARFVCVAVS